MVFVTGAELSLMNPGFLPGDNLIERVELLTNAAGIACRNWLPKPAGG